MGKLHDVEHTFIFEEVAHARPAREDKLRNVLDDLRLRLWRESREPFRKAHFAYGNKALK